MKLKIKLIISTMACLAGILIFPSFSHASFNSSYIMPDDVFRNTSTMTTEAQIQDFLNARGGYLAQYTIPASHNKSYYIQVYNSATGRYESKYVTSYINSWIGPVGAEVDATGWSVAKVILEASKWYNVNPQFIISLLQKESSMVTDPINRTSPETFARMAWVAGYAYTEDPESPIVEACYTDTNHNPTGSCAGVAMQIDWAAGTLHYWYNRAQSGSLTCNGGQACWPGQSPSIDGQRVVIGNNIDGYASAICCNAS